MNYFDFHEEPSQADHFGFLNREASNNNRGVKNLKGGNFKNSPERKPIITNKNKNNHQQEESEELFSGFGRGFNFEPNIGGNILGGSSQEESEFLFSGFSGNDHSSKFSNNMGAASLNFLQTLTNSSSHVAANSSNTNASFNNKKKSSDMEREMREMESLLTNRKQIPQNPQIPLNKRNSHPQANITSNNQIQQMPSNYYNKRSRIDMSIQEETEEDENFFSYHGQSNQDYIPKPNNSKKIKNKSENTNSYSTNIPLQNKNQFNQPNPNHQAIRREKEPNLFNNANPPQIAAESMVKKSKRNKKVVLEEPKESPVDKEALMQEMRFKYFELEKTIHEKKDKLKRIMSISKVYEKYYQKTQDFSKRLPLLVLKYLQSYQDFLFKANQLLSVESSDVDKIIQKNETVKKEIEEKFQFFKQV